MTMEKQHIAPEMQIEGYRLSPQQKRLWELQQGFDRSPYCVYGVVRIEGLLDADMLSVAVQQVINRHEMLRTTFRCLPGMTIPVQIIHDGKACTLQYLDLSDLGAQEQKAEVERFALLSRQHHFILEQELLIHLALLRLAPCVHVLLIALPALCADAVGLENLVREISTAYAACTGLATLNDDVLQYADLATWQNDLLESADAQEHRNYWKLLDLAATRELELYCERSRVGSGFDPRYFTLEIEPSLAGKIQALAQGYENATAALLCACWQILLWRICGQKNLVLGIVSDGRTYEELKSVPGLLARYVPLPCHLQQGLALREAVKLVDQALVDASASQEYFCWDQQLDATNEPQHPPPFLPFSFEFQVEPASYVVGKVTFTLCERYACTDQFKVKLSCLQKGQTLVVTCHYDAQRFAQEDMQRLVGEFSTLLACALEHPERAIEELAVLDRAEQQQLLVEWNDSEVEYPAETSIIDLFVAQVVRTPENIAVLFEGHSITYRDLNARANQLAHYLRRLGVGPEALVGVCLERSLDLVISLLAILKAGGAFVPLDLSYPAERLTSMIQDAGIAVTLTQKHLRGRLPEDHAARVICLDIDRAAIACESDSNPAVHIEPHQLAYAIYTSGSTGKPRGIMVEHRSLTNYLCWVQNSLLNEEIHRLPLVTRLSFDASLKQVFAPLLQGDAVWLLPDEVVSDPVTLLQELCTRVPMALNCVPSLWEALLDLLQAQPSLAAACYITDLFVGGEPLTKEIVRKSLVVLPHVRIHNLYGPTEATANATWAKVTSEEDISIGRPIANTRIYLLDPSLQLVPVGVPGEVYIGGVAIARGYLASPTQTAERFIPDPFNSEPGGRLYRTGDRARYLPTGNLEYLGRLDFQIKVRGFRIEPGEIEAVLKQHPSVRATVVTAREEVPGQKYLVAYIVVHDGHTLTTNAIHSYLKLHLPDYMIPSTFARLRTLPLMPNGKIDRSALPAPEKADRLDNKAFVAPCTPLEEVLALIWAEYLGVERVGVCDDFFASGGNSLLIVKVVVRLREVFQVELPLRTFFDASTVEDLARLMTAQEAESGQAEQAATAFLRRAGRSL